MSSQVNGGLAVARRRRTKKTTTWKGFASWIFSSTSKSVGFLVNELTSSCGGSEGSADDDERRRKPRDSRDWAWRSTPFLRVSCARTTPVRGEARRGELVGTSNGQTWARSPVIEVKKEWVAREKVRWGERKEEKKEKKVVGVWFEFGLGLVTRIYTLCGFKNFKISFSRNLDRIFYLWQLRD